VSIGTAAFRVIPWYRNPNVENAFPLLRQALLHLYQASLIPSATYCNITKTFDNTKNTSVILTQALLF